MRFNFACLLVVYLGLMFVASGTTAAAKESSPAAPPAKTLEFDGQTLVLAWEGGEPGSPIREYIPAGETLDHWTHLASIREFASIDDPRALAAKTLEGVRQTYLDTPSTIMEDPTSDDTIIDFVAWPDDKSFAEYNVFKYSKRPGGGVIAQQYAVRAYGNVDEFAKNLIALRERLTGEMASTALQSK